MALLRPSLTLVLDLDERMATTDTVLEIKRCYTYIGTPVIRSHAPASEKGSVTNTAHMLVGLGTRKYLKSTDEGADELWDTVVAQWIDNMLRKIGTTMRAFNTRQRKIKLPEVVFDRFDVELQGGELVVSLHTDPESFVDEALAGEVTQARTLLNDGTLEGAVRVEMPSDESYAAQYESAWELWVAEHPELGAQAVAEVATPDSGAKEAEDLADGEQEEAEKPADEPALTREEWLELDKQAKSYENTAVPPTDSETLPPIEREEEPPEPERFTFAVDYACWNVIYADGTSRLFDAGTQQFADAISQDGDAQGERDLAAQGA